MKKPSELWIVAYTGRLVRNIWTPTQGFQENWVGLFNVQISIQARPLHFEAVAINPRHLVSALRESETGYPYTAKNKNPLQSLLWVPLGWRYGHKVQTTLINVNNRELKTVLKRHRTTYMESMTLVQPEWWGEEGVKETCRTSWFEEYIKSTTGQCVGLGMFSLPVVQEPWYLLMTWHRSGWIGSKV